MQNITRTHPTNIPLLYTCTVCGAMLTIPPKGSPIQMPSDHFDPDEQ